MSFLRNGDADDPQHLEKLLALPAFDPETALAAQPAPAPDPAKPTDAPTEDRPTDDNEVAGRAGPGGLPPLAQTEIIPPWMRRPVDSAQWAARYVAHIVGFHAFRLPKYLGRAAAFTPRGAGRAVNGLFCWAADTEAHPLRRDAIARKSHLEYIALTNIKKKSQKQRIPGALLLVAVAGGVVWAGMTAYGTVGRLVTVLGVILALGWHGRPMGEPFIPSAVVTDPKARRITLDLVSRALIKAGLATEKDPPDFLGKPGRDGKAWTVIVDLPEGRTVSEAIKHQNKIASAMRVSSGRLFVTPIEGPESHEARFDLRIADTDPMTGPPVPSPLKRRDRIDIWRDGIPFGSDSRGKRVDLHPLWTHSLFSGITGTGKTFSLRLLVLGLALDPTIRFGVFDAGASPDWRDMALIADRCGFDDSDETCRLLVGYLRECVADMTKRMDAISKLPRAQAREGKLTKALAKRFPLTFIMLEECQDYFTNETYGTEIRRLVTKLVKRGRKPGYFVCLVTQRPDADAVPTAIRAQFGFRFALRLDNAAANDMALGTGMKDRGFDAVALSPSYKGVGYAVGELVAAKYPVGGTIVRCDYLDGDDGEKILLRCKAAREELGLLSGMAAGEEPVQWSMVDDIAAVFTPEDEWLWSWEIIARLVEARPGRYDQFTPMSFGYAVQGCGLTTVQRARRIDGKVVNNQALLQADLVEARLAAQRLSEPEEDDE